MPQKTITYDILVSCPSDVKQYIIYVKEAISKFNNGYGKEHGVGLRTLYWEDDSFSESGGIAQELLNAQIVDGADMAIAVFWTRFGTKTQHYGSGSEEEIEKMLGDKKQVFVYFLSKGTTKISEINPKELNKVNIFKKKYKGKGIYFNVNDEMELKQKINDDLENYFRKKVKKKP